MTPESPEAQILEITGILEDAATRLKRVIIRNSLVLAIMALISAFFALELWYDGGYRQVNIFLDFLFVVFITLTIPTSILISLLYSLSNTRRAVNEIRADRLEKAQVLLSKGMPWKKASPDSFLLLTQAIQKIEGRTAMRKDSSSNST